MHKDGANCHMRRPTRKVIGWPSSWNSVATRRLKTKRKEQRGATTTTTALMKVHGIGSKTTSPSFDLNFLLKIQKKKKNKEASFPFLEWKMESSRWCSSLPFPTQIWKKKLKFFKKKSEIKEKKEEKNSWKIPGLIPWPWKQRIYVYMVCEWGKVYKGVEDSNLCRQTSLTNDKWFGFILWL